MSDHQVTYKFADIFTGRTLAELPLKEVTFSKVVNGSGPWQGTLNIEDRSVRRSNWLRATAVWRSALWVDIDGVLVYGGLTTNRPYQMGAGTVVLSGADHCAYLAYLLQAKSYNFAAVPALGIAADVIEQALARPHTIPIRIVKEGPLAPEEYQIAFAAPEEQHQTVASILSQLQGLGFKVGIDYAADVAYVNGLPVPTITLSYPRRGALFTALSKVIDLSNALDLQYDEDGTQQANSIVEQAGATVDRSSEGEWVPAVEAGYPLLEATFSHPALAPTAGTNADQLRAYTAGDLSTHAYPLTAPVVKLPLFDTPSIFDLSPIGDDVLVRSPVVAGDQALTNPRFPEGMAAQMRTVRMDVTIPDEGVPTMDVTLNAPPTLIPVEPPVTTGGGVETGREKLEKEEEERATKEKLEKEEKEAKEKEDAEAKEKEEKEHAEEEATKKAETEELAKKAFEEAVAAKKEAARIEEPALKKELEEKAKALEEEAVKELETAEKGTGEEVTKAKEEATKAKKEAEELKGDAQSAKAAEEATWGTLIGEGIVKLTVAFSVAVGGWTAEGKLDGTVATYTPYPTPPGGATFTGVFVPPEASHINTGPGGWVVSGITLHAAGGALAAEQIYEESFLVKWYA